MICMKNKTYIKKPENCKVNKQLCSKFRTKQAKCQKNQLVMFSV